MDDILSDVFRLIRLQGCVYFARDFWSPWGIDIGAGSVSQFHAVVRGNAVLRLADSVHELDAGDVALVSRGDAHILADDTASPAMPGDHVMRSLATDAPCFAQGQKPTQVVCGHFSFRNDFRHPLLDQLPDVVRIVGFDALSSGTADSVLPLLVKELRDPRPGAASVVERLAEVLLIQLLRAHLVREPRVAGFLGALGDQRLAGAIRLIHNEPSRDLSLELLAAAAGMSRSAFARHFRHVTGLSPIDYLTRWRMYLACDLLSGGVLSLDPVAERVGYESVVAFGRAFKRVIGVSPGAYSRGVSADPA